MQPHRIALLLAAALTACDDAKQQSPPTIDAAAGVACPDPGDGYAAPAWSGPVYLTQRLVAPPATAGAPVDGALDVTGDDVPDSRLNVDHQLESELNYFIAHSGYVMHQFTALELAGLCMPLPTDDPAVSVKYYRVRTCDPNRADNFCYGNDCGRMQVNTSDLSAGQALFRWPPAPLRGGQLLTEIGPASVLFDAEVRPGFSLALTLHRARLRLVFSAGVEQQLTAMLCGAVPIRELTAMQIVEVAGALMVVAAASDTASVAGDLLRRVDGAGLPLQPDVDLDGDGLETYTLDGATIVCRDGDGERIAGASCLRDAAMADAFSVCFELTALRAELTYASCDAGG